MSRVLSAAVLAACIGIVGACAHDSDSSTKAAAAPTSTNTDSGDVNPQDPKAGLNTNRPDSAKDVKQP